MNARLSLTFAAIAISASMANPAPVRAQQSHTLTIYVEEGNPNGHVFLGVSNGNHEERWGWYTGGKTTFQKLKGLASCGGGELRPDDKTPYDVYKTYPITQHAYYVLKSHILAQRAAGEGETASWAPWNHCGDFVVDAASAAGIPLKLPYSVTGHTRPGLFANYLLTHGGSRHDRTTSNTQSKWDGTYVSGAYTIVISGGVGSLKYQADRNSGGITDHVTSNSCTVNGSVATCTETGKYHDSDKDVQSTGEQKLTLSGETIYAVLKVKTASITLSGGRPCPDIAQCTGIHPGAEFSGTWTRRKP